MKISIQEGPEFAETEVIVRCREATPQVMSMVAALRVFDQKLTGEREGRTFLLDARDVLYAETVDKRAFLYTADGVFETPLRLYELEERLASRDFFRAGKSIVVNFSQIKSIRPDFGGRLELTMTNGERLFVSRQYVPVVKQKLGLT